MTSLADILYLLKSDPLSIVDLKFQEYHLVQFPKTTATQILDGARIGGRKGDRGSEVKRGKVFEWYY